ncbi:hypothetical protein SEA_LIGMA_83 [Gordonia phage Ligma]|nr:hypothetical protein SEA_LIGMA_83 [Gordonia phage Ligma]UQT02182.1 hypothetical protein SEA_AXUMITE_83 [Gordonia phage Axumite]
MGTTYEVDVWVPVGEGYEWQTRYEGFWLPRAVWAWFRARRDGGCVRMVWRG